MEISKNRIFYFDELRALAILLVILCHIGQYFPTNVYTLTSPIPLSYMSIGRMGVPLFFMISGALLINKDYTLTSYFKKRLIRVIIPAVFWTLVSILVYSTYVSYSDAFYYGWYLNNGFLWFIFAILGIYLVIPLFNSFVKEYGIRGCEFLLVLWILLLLANHFNFIRFYYVGLLFDGIGIYTGYAVLGYYLANKDFNILSGPMIIFSGILFIAMTAYNLHTVNSNVVIIDYLSFSLILQCASLFLVLRYISRYAEFKPDNIFSLIHNLFKNSIIGKLIYVVSACSYGIYFIHCIIISYVSNNFIITDMGLLAVLFIVISVVSIDIMILSNFIPLLNRFAGIK